MRHIGTAFPHAAAGISRRFTLKFDGYESFAILVCHSQAPAILRLKIDDEHDYFIFVICKKSPPTSPTSRLRWPKSLQIDLVKRGKNV
jgi:hypothetical protein